MSAVYIIDHFDGKWAVIESDDRQIFRLPREILPPEAREGDVIAISATVDRKASRTLQDKATNLLKNFFDS